MIILTKHSHRTDQFDKTLSETLLRHFSGTVSGTEINISNGEPMQVNGWQVCGTMDLTRWVI